METIYHVVNHDLRPEQRAEIEQELLRVHAFVKRFPRPVAHVEVERSPRKGGFGVGIHIKLSTRPLFASAWGGDLRSAVGMSVDRLVGQVKKHLDRLRKDERAGAESPRAATWERSPSAAELEALRGFEDFWERVSHHAARLNQVLRRERRLDARAEQAGGSVSIPDIIEEAIAFVYEHWREKPSELTPDRWLVRRGLLLLDEELERTVIESSGPEVEVPPEETQEDWEELMNLPMLEPTEMDRRPADEALASPEMLRDRRRAQKATAEALKGLGDRQRRSVLLHHLEGYDPAEIGYVLNASEEQVEQWILEGETELQDQLSSWRGI